MTKIVEAYSKPCETLTRQLRNLLLSKQFIEALFSQIQAYSGPCLTRAFTETWNI